MLLLLRLLQREISLINVTYCCSNAVVVIVFGEILRLFCLVERVWYGCTFFSILLLQCLLVALTFHQLNF